MAQAGFPELRHAERLAKLLDSRYGLPGTPLRFGWDGLLGLIPVVGDLATALPGLYYLYLARRWGLGWGVYLGILVNVGLDFLVGAVPVVGDLLDFGFRANQRSVRLLRQGLARRRRDGDGEP